MGTDTEDYIRELAVENRPDLTVAFFATEVFPAFQCQRAARAWQQLLAPGQQRYVEEGAAIIAAYATS